MCKVRDNYVILKVWDGTLPSHKIELGALAEVHIRIVHSTYIMYIAQVVPVCVKVGDTQQ